MDVAKTVNAIVEKNDGEISGIYLVACGGSLVDMYVSDYFLKAEASKCITGLYTANEFNRIRQKSPILYRWVMNAVRYEGYR
ncbi:hypothetical protein LC940_14730, partial [Enterococcus faecium]|nr:hypothetical protein [Enterococcus faecium]